MVNTLKTYRLGLILILSVTISLFSSIPIQNVNGFSFTYQPFWFFISEPQRIEYDEMIFMVTNTENYPIRVECSYTSIENLNVSVGFTWENNTLLAGETKSNHYWFIVGENFNITANIRMTIHKQRLDINGSQLTVGGGIINQISYYSEEQGSKMTVDVVDQSMKRISNISVNMFHRANKSVPWTPIYKTVNAFTGYFPHGHYLILANDLDSGETGESKFEFIEDKTVHVEIQLVGFGVFYYMEHIKNSTLFLQLNTTINNFVGTLEEVVIYAELQKENVKIDETNKEYRQEFSKTIALSQSFWFPPITPISGNYSIVGKIYSLEILIATKTIQFELIFESERSIPEENFYSGIIGMIGSIIIVLSFGIYSVKNQREINRLRNKTEVLHENK
jgi:hypothetical protein